MDTEINKGNYILYTVSYDSNNIIGIKDLNEALSYIQMQKPTKLSDKKMSDTELLERAMTDHWSDTVYIVEMWQNMKKIKTYKYNDVICEFEEQTIMNEEF